MRLRQISLEGRGLDLPQRQRRKYQGRPRVRVAVACQYRPSGPLDLLRQGNQLLVVRTELTLAGFRATGGLGLAREPGRFLIRCLLPGGHGHNISPSYHTDRIAISSSAWLMVG